MKRILIILLKFYKKYFSIFFYGSCKYYPSCSTYFLQAVESFGVLKGSFLGFKRLFKCSPFFKGGCDFVEKHNKK